MLTPHIKMVSLSNPSKIRTAPSVINVGFDNLYAVVFRKLCQHLLLACYGIALTVNVAIVNR